MAENPNRVAARAIRQARRMGATPREVKALVAAGLVESGLQHARYGKVGSGDRDSVGFLQQRPSQGWGAPGESIEKDTKDFLKVARKINRSGFKGSAGQLAQAVQRSAFPARYDQRGRDAEKILARFGDEGGAGAGGGLSTGRSPAVRRVRETETIPGVDRSADRQALKLGYLNQRGRPDALLALAAGLKDAQDTPAEMVTTTRTERIPTGNRGRSEKVARRDGVRGSSSEIKEMFYNGPGAAVNADNGRRVQKGFVSGHASHVHVAAGPKRIREIARFAQSMGLTVRELEGFDKVDPVHTGGSYHYRGRAADISGDPKLMAEFTRRIARRFNL